MSFGTKKQVRVPYDVHEPSGWADGVAGFAQRHLDGGAVVVLYGNCPRCGDLMDVELPIALQTGGLTVSAETDAEALGPPDRTGAGALAFPKTARCNCQMGHEGRPKEVGDGCGAFGTIEVG
jgi:hypothetical protein